MRKIFLLPLFCLASCALFRPGGPTEAGVANMSAALDTNKDGQVSVDELKAGLQAGVVSRDWESLIWTIVTIVGGGAGVGVATNKLMQKKKPATA